MSPTSRDREIRALANSSETGAAMQKAMTSSHKAPSPCADFSTSPMKPGVMSRPSARESKVPARDQREQRDDAEGNIP